MDQPRVIARMKAASLPLKEIRRRRVRLRDDAGPLFRDDAYQRRRDLVDWLIRWACKVFG